MRPDAAVRFKEVPGLTFGESYLSVPTDATFFPVALHRDLSFELLFYLVRNQKQNLQAVPVVKLHLR